MSRESRRDVRTLCARGRVAASVVERGGDFRSAGVMGWRMTAPQTAVGLVCTFTGMGAPLVQAICRHCLLSRLRAQGVRPHRDAAAHRLVDVRAVEDKRVAGLEPKSR